MLIHTADRGMSQRKYLYTHSLILHSKQKLWKLIFLFKMKCQAFTLLRTPRRLAGSKRHHTGSQSFTLNLYQMQQHPSLHPVQPQTDTRVVFSKPPFFFSSHLNQFFSFLTCNLNLPSFSCYTLSCHYRPW